MTLSLRQHFRVGVAKQIFNHLDHWMYQREIRYAKRTHPNKSYKWLKERYFGKLNPNRENHWVFGDKSSGRYLLRFSWFEIERYVLVRGKASPDDPELRSYWQAREQAKAKNLGQTQRKLARRQDYRCVLCQASLFNEEDLHQHHLQPRSQGGTDELSNQVLVHLYCHQQIHNGNSVKVTKRELLRE